SLKRIGLIERLRASDFPKKYSVQFISESGKLSKPFYFYEQVKNESAVTWQVDRAEFYSMLLDNAREKGADVRVGWTAEKGIFEGDKALGVAGPDARGG